MMTSSTTTSTGVPKPPTSITTTAKSTIATSTAAPLRGQQRRQFLRPQQFKTHQAQPPLQGGRPQASVSYLGTLINNRKEYNCYLLTL